MRVPVFAILLTICCVSRIALADAIEVRGRVVDQSGGALPGVTITLALEAGTASFDTVTDAQGAYEFAAAPGRYRLHAELAGFMAIDRDVIVASAPVTLELQLAIAPIAQEVTVTAEAPRPLIDDTQPDAPSTVTREVIDSAMLPNSQYDDVLSLMPNVVRGPDGAISVAGARSPQGALFVNGMNATDPITGGAGYIVPIDAIDSMQVYSGGYPADLGRATGGVTAALTRSGADKFHMMLDSAFPRLLFENGGVQGVEFWEPNMGASGPLARGRLFFQQAVSYRFDRNSFSTLAGHERNVYDSLLSWSQIDANLSRGQHLRFSVGLDPQTTDHAGVTAFTPAPSMPRLDQGGWNAAVAHETLGPHGLVAVLHASMMRTKSNVTPSGDAPYELGHDLLTGSYFDRQSRSGERIELGASAARVIAGHHLVKGGVDVERNALDGNESSAPATLLRGDGTPSRTITFLPAPPIHVASVDAGVFVQDTWTPRRWATIDLGARYDRTSGIGDAAVSPRIAWTLKPTPATTLSGSAGRFADKVPLLALAFPLLTGRVIQVYGPAGAASVPAVTAVNRVGAPLTTPLAERWNVEWDQRFGTRFLVRSRYEERRGHDELVVDSNVLTSSGSSRARSLETTAGYRTARRGDFYVSYVRAATRGDLNSLDVVEGIFREPFIQPNEVGPLPADVPNRVLTWGLFHLPGELTVAPFVDVRNGFPYRAINDDWLYVGSPDAFRMPWFGSLDLSINKIVDLPGRLPAARVGAKFYNLASTHTGREVQRDIASPDFGAIYNPIPRDFAFVFELLWGRR